LAAGGSAAQWQGVSAMLGALAAILDRVCMLRDRTVSFATLRLHVRHAENITPGLRPFRGPASRSKSVCQPGG
jgi:hypothetical protein